MSKEVESDTLYNKITSPGFLRFSFSETHRERRFVLPVKVRSINPLLLVKQRKQEIIYIVSEYFLDNVKNLKL